MKKALINYNETLKHLAFKNKYSPNEFRRNLIYLNDKEIPRMIIYSEGKEKIKRHRISLSLIKEKNLIIIIVLLDIIIEN